MDTKIIRRADWLGAFSSGLCIVHCLVFPMAMLLQLGNIAEPGVWHYGSYVFLGFSFMALLIVIGHLHTAWLKLLFAALFSLLALSTLLEDSLPYAEYTSILAGTGLMAIHLWHLVSEKKPVHKQHKTI